MKTITRVRAVTVIAAAALALASCTAAGPSGPVDWDDDLDLGVPGEVVDVHQGVPFYPACGNEVLTWVDDTYFPYNPSQLSAFPDPTDLVSRASSLLESAPVGWVRMSIPLPAVVAPGPGDDIGALVVYEGGHAYWESDSGELSTWLTTTELEYRWIC